MKEDWEIKWEDYYSTLGVTSNADNESIKTAFRYKAQILHPDHTNGLPDFVKKRAENDFKKVNRAFATLNNPQKRPIYHAAWIQHFSQTESTPKSNSFNVIPPKPILEPLSFSFDDQSLGTQNERQLILRNGGGPYKKLSYYCSNLWIEITNTSSVNPPSKLPLRMTVRVTCDKSMNWGGNYTGLVIIKMDSEVRQVKVQLNVKGKPIEKPITEATPKPQMLICSKCGQVNEQIRLYCKKPYCAEILQPITCKVCRTTIPKSSAFCSECGTKQ